MRRVDPKGGDTREQEKFLLLPKRIWNEVRWLEVARWREVYDGYSKQWKCNAWLDRELQR